MKASGEVALTTKMPLSFIYLIALGLLVMALVILSEFLRPGGRCGQGNEPLCCRPGGVFIFWLLLVLRMPIAIAMSLVGFAGCLYLVSPEAALRIVAKIYTQHFLPLIL